MDLKDEADKALEATIREFRPNHSGSWKMISPGEFEPAISRPGEWMNFLATVVGRYNLSIAPQKCAAAETFTELYPKIFRTIRDKMAESVQ